MIVQRKIPLKLFAGGRLHPHAMREAMAQAEKRGFSYVEKCSIPARLGTSIAAAWRDSEGNWLLLRGQTLAIIARS